MKEDRQKTEYTYNSIYISFSKYKLIWSDQKDCGCLGKRIQREAKGAQRKFGKLWVIVHSLNCGDDFKVM